VYVGIPEVLTEHFNIGSPEFFSSVNAPIHRDLRGLTKAGNRTPTCRGRDQNKGLKRRHARDSFTFVISRKNGGFFCIPMEILAFNIVYDIFFYGKKKYKRILIME
jgi:hypothetical protein